VSRTTIPETVQYRCDRCDAVAQDDRIEAWGGYGEIPNLIEAYPGIGGDEILGSTAYDLCARCTKALHEFLDTPPDGRPPALAGRLIRVENGVDGPGGEEAPGGSGAAP